MSLKGFLAKGNPCFEATTIRYSCLSNFNGEVVLRKTVLNRLENVITQQF